MKYVLLTLLLLPVVVFGQKNARKADPRSDIDRREDSVWVCIAKTGSTEYARGGVCHINPECVSLKECIAHIKKVKFFQARNTWKTRRCEICCKQ